jgi:hypothetical protein
MRREDHSVPARSWLFVRVGREAWAQGGRTNDGNAY